MKHVLILLITLLTSLTVFSQSVTDNSKVVLSYPVAKQIALDLNSWDSLKTAYEVTMNVLNLTEKKISYKDSVINGYDNKMSIYKQQVFMYEAKEESYKNIVSILKTDIAKQKAKNRITIGASAFITVTTIFILRGLMH